MPFDTNLKLNIKKLSSLNLTLKTIVNNNAEWLISPEGGNSGKAVAMMVSKMINANEKRINAVSDEVASSFATILERHPAFKGGETWLPKGSTAYLDQFKKEKDFNANLSLETVSILAAGLQTFASIKLHDPNYIEALLMIALGADSSSLQLRKQITELIPNWKPVLPPSDKLPSFIIPGNEPNCVSSIRQGFHAAGKWLSQANSLKLPEVNTASITGIMPNSGGYGTSISINGIFPSTKPEQSFVAFTGQDGKPILVPIEDNEWTITQINTVVPPQVGDGYVAIVTLFGQLQQGDPSEALQFSESLAGCFGSGVYRIANSLSGQIWSSLEIEIPAITANPGNTNIFHGGPLLIRVLTTEAHDYNHVNVEGMNIMSGDNLSIDGILCNTIVNGNFLEAYTDKMGIRGGIREVKIIRGNCSSQSGTVRMLPNVDGLKKERGNPGGYFIFDGACFSENDITATINGVHSPKVFLDPPTNGNSLWIEIPKNTTPIKSDPDGEECEIILFDRGTQLGNSFKGIIETYRIVALGDSIMWGQGLLESQKFTELVGQRIISNGKNVYRQDRSANSGAKIMNNTGEPDFNCGASPSLFDIAAPGLPVNFEGEKNCGASSVVNQVSEWSKLPIDVRNRVDLVLIDGGINDVGVTTILSPLISENEIASQATVHCSKMNSILLANPGTFNAMNSALAVFPNATILVTGYYPIVSKNSDALMIMKMANDISYGAIPLLTLAVSLLLRDSFVIKSKIFAETANEVLRLAVEATKDSRVKFTVPEWNDNNSLFAPESFLFGLTSVGVIFGAPEDPVATSRVPLCSTPCRNTGTSPTSSTCAIASLGHPNAKGALAYADAIMKVL